jgi:RimJ/RimL family protein N-acetyltransferase
VPNDARRRIAPAPELAQRGSVGRVSIRIETERLTLRPLTIDDADALFLVLGDADTMVWYPAPYDRDGVVAWIDKQRQRYETDGFGLLGVEERASGELIGDCGPTIQHVDGEPHVELGWHTRRDRWGQGIATEGGAACREWCWTNLDVDHLISLIRPENRQSWRVAEKLGMTVWLEAMHAGMRHRVYRIDRGP